MLHAACSGIVAHHLGNIEVVRELTVMLLKGFRRV